MGSASSADGASHEPATDTEKPAQVVLEPAPRLDETPRGRRVLTAFLLVTMVAIGVSVMPDSTIRTSAMGVVRPYLLATGLDQRWGVFAPNPRQDTSHLEARIDHADGTVTVWTAPPATGVSEYWNYRWRKYAEQLWVERDRREERRALAAWVIDRERAEGREPVRVTLVRRTAESLPPGPGPDQGPWREEPISLTTVEAR